MFVTKITSIFFFNKGKKLSKAIKKNVLLPSLINDWFTFGGGVHGDVEEFLVHSPVEIVFGFSHTSRNSLPKAYRSV